MKTAKSKTLTRSSLQDIEGIGPKKAATLLKHFKTLKAVGEASVDTLLRVKGLSLRDAEAIYRHFHKNDESDKSEETV